MAVRQRRGRRLRLHRCSPWSSSNAAGRLGALLPGERLSRGYVRLRQRATTRASSTSRRQAQARVRAGYPALDSELISSSSASSRRARPSVASRMSASWFQTKAGRATGAARFIHHLVVRTSQS
jgi:hypothetical protein